MKYYLIAGERSGDLHGGNLIQELKKLDADASFKGFGGDQMQRQGMTLDRHYSDLAFMGFWEVVSNLFKIRTYLQEAKQAILAYKPDVVILIDYGGFNMKIASFLKQQNIRCYYYITPKVWAWNQGRAKKIKRLVDRMFVILPFEKDFYKNYDWDVDYVGNPVLDAVQAHEVEKPNLPDNKKTIALLPGSRVQEIKTFFDPVLKVVQSNPQWHFVVAKVDSVDQSLYEPIEGLDNVEFINGSTYDLMASADAAVVTSGTATLETALFKLPQVVVYKTSRVSYEIGVRVIKVGYISLVNLIANKPVVKELIQTDFNTKEVEAELKRMLENTEYRQRIISDYDMIENKLDIGSASQNTARLIYKYLTES